MLQHFGTESIKKNVLLLIWCIAANIHSGYSTIPGQPAHSYNLGGL